MRMADLLEEHFRGLDRARKKMIARGRSMADIVNEHQDLKSYWARGSIGAGITLFLRGDM